jgi:hypothetical protein
MADAFTVQGTLTFPPDEGAADGTVSFGFSGSATAKYTALLNLTTAASPLSIDLTTVGGFGPEGAKLVILEFAPATPGAPITVLFNGGIAPAQLEMSVNGFVAVGNPDPTVGITSIEVTHSAVGSLRVWALG